MKNTTSLRGHLVSGSLTMEPLDTCPHLDASSKISVPPLVQSPSVTNLKFIFKVNAVWIRFLTAEGVSTLLVYSGTPAWLPSHVHSKVCKTGKRVEFEEDSVIILDCTTASIVWTGYAL